MDPFTLFHHASDGIEMKVVLGEIHCPPHRRLVRGHGCGEAGMKNALQLELRNLVFPLTLATLLANVLFKRRYTRDGTVLVDAKHVDMVTIIDHGLFRNVKITILKLRRDGRLDPR